MTDAAKPIPNPYRGAPPDISLRSEDFAQRNTPAEIVEDILFFPRAEDVDLIFNVKVKALPRNEQWRVADALEARCAPFFTLADEEEDDGDFRIDDFHKFAAGMNIIAQVKGAEALPFVQRYAAGLAAMTDAEFNSCDAHAALIESCIDRPRPPRRPPQPGPF
jgi:hypothetical protein